MPATLAITAQIVEDAAVRSVQNVCRTMLRQNATLVSNRLDGVAHGADIHFEVIGSVGFAGSTNGMVYLCLTEDFARQATADILGMSLAEVEMHGAEVMRDAIGEITNMAAGGFKNELCDMGFPCKLGLPTILRGHNLAVAALKSATRHVLWFDIGGQHLVADILIKPE